MDLALKFIEAPIGPPPHFLKIISKWESKNAELYAQHKTFGQPAIMFTKNSLDTKKLKQ